MVAAVETMAWKGQKPWHGLGDEFTGKLTPKQMIQKAKIDWTVALRPLAYNTSRDPAEGFLETEGLATTKEFRALVRESDGKLLDIVGGRFLPTQNEEAFEFFQEFTTAGNADMETAGSLRGGRMIWGLANLNEGFKLAGGDEVRGYLLLTNPHEQGKARVIKVTSIRVVCWNTLSAALQGGGGEFRQSHRLVFDKAQQEIAKASLGLAREQFDKHKEDVVLLSKSTMSKDDAIGFITSVIDPELWAELKHSVSVVKERLEEKKAGKKLALTVDALDNSPGASLKSSKGTMWGVLNAVTFAVDHQFGKGADQRLTKAWFGTGATLKQRAFSSLIDLAKK